MDSATKSETERVKRFYDKAQSTLSDGSYQVMLDGALVQTPAKATVLVPSEKLAEALALEWQSQGEWIEHEKMPLTKLVNTAIDGVADRRDVVIAEIVNYAGSDLICYLAEEPQELMMRQMAQWGPVIDWIAQGLGARFEVEIGINPVEQPAPSLERVRQVVSDFDTFSLTAVHAMTTLTGSALLTLANIAQLFDLITVWQSAHLEEDWQIARWGQDAEAVERRERRWQEMQAADKLFNYMR